MAQALNFHGYMQAYADDHRHPVNQACHMLGIPLIVASLPLAWFAPRLSLKLFGAGWVLQFVGHYVEGKKPSFTRDPNYLAIGPVWVLLKWGELLTGTKLYRPPGQVSAENLRATSGP